MTARTCGFNGMLDMVGVRVASYGIFPKNYHAPDRPILQAVHHLHDGVSHPIGESCLPRVLEFLLVALVRDSLGTRIHIRQAPHVASALHVVLSAKGFITPVMHLPRFPVIMARFARLLTLSTPWVCWVMPMVYRMEDDSAVA